MESLVKTVLRALVRTLEDNDRKSHCSANANAECSNNKWKAFGIYINENECHDLQYSRCMSKSQHRSHGDEKKKVEDDKEDNKKPQVYYYYAGKVSRVAYSDIGGYYYAETPIANSEGKLLENHNLYYRGMQAEGLNGNDDSVWESLTMITSPNDQIIAEANYSQNPSLTGQTTTVSDQETFIVTGSSGKFEGAKKIVVEYDNDLKKCFSPNMIKDHPVKVKFRRVTVHY